ANSIQRKLQASKGEELKGSTFPVAPASIVRYQRDHPEMLATSVTEIAPRLGVSRLIYVEVREFHTRSLTAPELFRGQADVDLKVVEINSGQARIGYTENGLGVVFPKGITQDGAPGLGDFRMYAGTIDTLAEQVAKRLTTHLEPRS
ncbi:MAG: hypothetical protein ACREJC_12465, partial [Tepidisphaeraceae bacterium]